MILIVGLGNPGEKYRLTRHNIGREIVSVLKDKTASSEFIYRSKWNSLAAQGKISGKSIGLLLPETMMNNSGKAVAAAARFFKIKPKDIFVIHDDADIPLGSAKLSFSRGSAGHKGVESVIRALKTRDFWRFRIGIAGKRDVAAENLVLKKFTPAEITIVKRIVKKTVAALETAVRDGPEKAMNEYNR